jgi:hypothetical protein
LADYPCGQTQQPVISGQEDVGSATFRASEMQRIERLKTQRLQFTCPFHLGAFDENELMGTTCHRSKASSLIIVTYLVDLVRDHLAGDPKPVPRFQTGDFEEYCLSFQANSSLRQIVERPVETADIKINSPH